MEILLMNCQTWAYVHNQLDLPDYAQIKIHWINPDTNKSYCGLQNKDDLGYMEYEQYRNHVYACKKCIRYGNHRFSGT